MVPVLNTPTALCVSGVPSATSKFVLFWQICDIIVFKVQTWEDSGKA